MLVALEALTEIVLGNQPALHQHFERAIDRGLANTLATGTQPRFDVFHRLMLCRLEYDFCDRLALLRYGQALVAQIAAEQVQECAVRRIHVVLHSQELLLIADTQTARNSILFQRSDNLHAIR